MARARNFDLEKPLRHDGSWLFPLFVDDCMYMTTALCIALESFASTLVRTEPRATSAIPEEKNSYDMMVAAVCASFPYYLSW